MSLPEEAVEKQWNFIRSQFGSRHFSIERYFLERCSEVSTLIPPDAKLSETRRLLIGTYFSEEYSLEAAALCNPSVVPCPDQSGLTEGALRIVLSLRAVGEGHISSVCFRCGVLTPDFELELSEPARWVVEPQMDVDETFIRETFELKAREMGIGASFLERVMRHLPEKFPLTQLVAATVAEAEKTENPACAREADSLQLLARSNFSVHFDPGQRYSERAIFPVSPSQTHGIEDARFVQFTEDDGTVHRYATYTAYDGRATFPQLIETPDFLHFRFHTLQGKAVQNKGMAMFPQRIGGRYTMLSRQDNENLRIMFSDDLYRWDSSEVIASPAHAWEFIKVGNCGSPIELNEGWLVLTHGVGAMRRYCIGAILLDKRDPRKVLGRLAEPLIEPSAEDPGYVPNVVYTCGGLVHRAHLFLPYATSDQFTSFAVVPVSDILREMP